MKIISWIKKVFLKNDFNTNDIGKCCFFSSSESLQQEIDSRKIDPGWEMIGPTDDA